MIYILTRTAERPSFFANLRRSVKESGIPHLHIVHSEIGRKNDYIEADIIVEDYIVESQPRTFGPEIYHQRLLQTIQDLPPGWVIFIDDDDIFVPGALRRIQELCTDPDTLYVWRTRRERNRMSPVILGAPLNTDEGRICWESAAFHTSYLQDAIPLVKNDRLDNDAQFWASLSKIIPKTKFCDEVMIEPQIWNGKGKGRRQDMPQMTVAVPVLGRPQNISLVASRFGSADINLLFLPDPDDAPTIQELNRLKLQYSFAHVAEQFGVPTYATKINHAYNVTNTPYLFYGSDDIRPMGSWLPLVLSEFKDPAVGLVAVNDRHRLVLNGYLATHGAVRREYVEKYGSASLPDAGPVMYEGYRHWWVDCEISYVARQRKAFKLCARANFYHERLRRSDNTYKLGESFAAADRQVALPRLPGWPEQVQA